MGVLSPRRIRIRGERLNWYWLPWSLLALFIIVGSAGRWAPYEPGIWAPTLINPKDVARNVALYVPFGLFGVLALGHAGRRGIARVTALALIFSAANEAVQLYTVDRVASLTDIASAVVGTVAGAALAAMFGKPR